MYEVTYAGYEESFETMGAAVDFQNKIDCGSDIWFEDRLIRTRMKHPVTGEFTVETYDA